MDRGSRRFVWDEVSATVLQEDGDVDEVSYVLVPSSTGVQTGMDPAE